MVGFGSRGLGERTSPCPGSCVPRYNAQAHLAHRPREREQKTEAQKFDIINLGLPLVLHRLELCQRVFFFWFLSDSYISVGKLLHVRDVCFGRLRGKEKGGDAPWRITSEISQKQMYVLMFFPLFPRGAVLYL